MFLHLGGEKVVCDPEIIGIFNYDLVNKSRDTKEFIEIMTTEQNLVKIKEEIKTKSFVVTTEKVFLSPISSVTLQKRVFKFKEA